MFNRIFITTLLVMLLSTFPTAFAGDPAGFKHQSEAGIVVSSGNSKAQTYNLKQETEYGWDSNVTKFFGHFLKSTSKGIESARNWDLGLRYERTFTEKLSGFVSEQIESDFYAGFFQRYNSDIGPKYVLVKESDLTWFAEAGYRYTIENETNGLQTKDSFLRLYTEANKEWDKSISTKLWFEYLPNLSNSTAWRYNTELSVSMVLTSVFSLKTAYLIKFDNLPKGSATEKTDTLFTTALVAKL